MPKVKKRKHKKLPEFKPEYVEAFLIIMLHKIQYLQKQLGLSGSKASQTLTIEQLETFCDAAKGKKTLYSYDAETNSVTISSPNDESPGEPQILVPGLVVPN